MRFFTIDEADGCILVLSRHLKRCQRLREKLAWLIETNDAMVEVNTDEGFHYFMTEDVRSNKEFHRLYYQFYRTLESIAKLGVIVKDVDDGLIDFPFKLNGRDVFLCWQLGEEKVSFWHDCENGYEARVPILDIDKFLETDSE